MTRRTVEVIESNISNDPAEVEVFFSINSNHYRMDLTEAEAKQFHATLDPYVAVAEVLPPRRGGARKRTYPVAAVREWAGRTGVELPVTGRIPNEVWDRFESEMAKKPKGRAKTP